MRITTFKFASLFSLLLVANVAHADLGTAIVGSIFGKKTVAQNLDAQKKVEADTSRALDPALFDHFYVVSNEGNASLPDALERLGYQSWLAQNNRVIIVHDVIKEQNFDEVDKHAANYTSTVGKDAVSERYVRFVKSRGNRVSLFKPAITNKIQDATGWPYPRPVAWHGLERCLVEFDKNNEVVSMLSRFHIYDTTGVVGVAKLTLTEIVFGSPTASRFENSIKAEELQDAFIRDMK